ncbi:Na+-dependent transporter, SNF family [Candidatus Thermokryptus mobilis]|uniref:Na+-dependent transporter, SNF family n=1 Tax=Candidatus Thermokryptus mobilis TaxID=1643428 RepID=A0A0S4MVC6_9BACT|nr:sodium-dependent transporter [Candidatus Thermokryptus mobilis]CUU01903.1 Na+-dependent transporter, SNF family [Candidatus Thermokryptus mobilis]
MAKRERWGTRIGLILAMAGNAVGLGNFLRFPVQAAQNGGGAFMIPYFTAFLLLGIPLMWVEWAVGRYGGKFGHGSAPGMFDAMWKAPISKYLGSIGLFISTVIMVYYTYIESWTLAFSFFSITKAYFGETTFEAMGSFLRSYQGIEKNYFQSILPAYLFMCFTLLINFSILYRGISRGIELLAKIAMPTLFLFAIILVIRVVTLGTPDPVNYPDRSVESGFAFIWNPDFSKLGDAKIWLAAAGQIFFTLSVGMGTLQAYASYLRESDDIALSGLSTAATNEFVEIILGASIAIPVAAAFFGIETTQEIAKGGAFNLGFVSMPIIFQKLPFGEFFGFLWFLLLFFAGITSSVAMAQPLIAFLKEEFGISHGRATAIIGFSVFICIQFVVFFLKHGFLDEMDYWAGTFGLVIFALFEIIIFAWIFGMKKGWAEIVKGADIKVPKIFYYIIKYITPLYLLFIMVNWLIQDAIPTLLMKGVNPEDVPYRWGARVLMLLIFLAIVLMVRAAWKNHEKTKIG